jgi:hypothetical protein
MYCAKRAFKFYLLAGRQSGIAILIDLQDLQGCKRPLLFTWCTIHEDINKLTSAT